MSELVFFLEEPSAEAMLQGLMPRILPPAITCKFIVFEGKHDLEKQLLKKIRGYRVPNAKFVVMRDKDAGNCIAIKKKLSAKCEEAGKPEALVRIACHELESWYLADLTAVQKGLGVSGLARLQNRPQYSAPDKFPFPSATLRKIAPTYQKVGGSRAIGPYLALENTRSNSFRVFVEGVRRICVA
ncbi:MAG: DUF4276 family protein [Chitinivibrionales bacterium]|nr:DUF4276 family protein [Chitinivibrionales bacterium]